MQAYTSPHHQQPHNFGTCPNQPTSASRMYPHRTSCSDPNAMPRISRSATSTSPVQSFGGQAGMPHMMEQTYAYDPYTQWPSQASFPSSTSSPMSDHLYYEPHTTYSQAQVDPRFVASTSPARPAAQPRSRTTSPQDAQAPRGLPGAADTRARNVECLLGGAACPRFFTLVPHQVKRGIAEHLHEHHRGGGASPDCSWDGCVCAAQSGRLGRCSDRPAEHPAHVSDLADHILHSHLGFRYLCDLCGRAQWSTPSALARHARTCRGVCPVRCPGCLEVFPSEVALESHVGHGGCYPDAI